MAPMCTKLQPVDTEAESVRLSIPKGLSATPRDSRATVNSKRNRTMILKHIFLLLSAILLLPAFPVHAATRVPHGVGGFTLGTPIDDYEFISYRNFLKQVVVDHISGFRKGIIEYGVCDNPGQIVKIKLKYLDSSEEFYGKLLKEYKKRFGEPDEFTGDTFGIVKSWKWRFRDKDGNRICLL